MIYLATKYGHPTAFASAVTWLKSAQCFCSVRHLGCIFVHRVCKEISRTPKHDSIKRKVTVLYAKQNASEKDKVCSSEIGCSRKGAKKMCHVSLLTDALLGMVAVSLAACVTGRVIYWACVFLHRCQEPCP